MVTQNTNPFVLPGFGQSGDMASNPMLASMEMMRKAWENLAQASGFDGTMLAAGTSPEELDRRISDLRAVENWLRMNLSLLSGTIQTLETQRATLATLQAFVASAGGARAPDSQSPLDMALGIPRGPGATPSGDTSGLFGDRTGKQAAGTAAADQGQAADAASSSTASAAAGDASGAADAAIKTWWDMLQAQFDNLASATAATLQGAGAMQDAATEAQKQAVDAARAAAQSMQESAESVMGSAGKTAKKASKKSAAKKTAAKKTATKKTAAKKTAARKTAAKKSASGKTASKTAAKTGAKRASKAAAKKSAGTGAQ
ncbi:MAG TPA: PhaM family polyhydroxyalkanoate granule multifunctional regulatory protein [Burkholderiaceae bacterium]|nr:PhaM family polyhydroxyalkanoate granule multifunctional regulatory protein [Burkholderiaceae bacterium]